MRSNLRQPNLQTTVNNLRVDGRVCAWGGVWFKMGGAFQEGYIWGPEFGAMPLTVIYILPILSLSHLNLSDIHKCVPPVHCNRLRRTARVNNCYLALTSAKKSIFRLPYNNIIIIPCEQRKRRHKS